MDFRGVGQGRLFNAGQCLQHSAIDGVSEDADRTVGHHEQCSVGSGGAAETAWTIQSQRGVAIASNDDGREMNTPSGHPMTEGRSRGVATDPIRCSLRQFVRQC